MEGFPSCPTCGKNWTTLCVCDFIEDAKLDPVPAEQLQFDFDRKEDV
jgi:hypothetical protein